LSWRQNWGATRAGPKAQKSGLSSVIKRTTPVTEAKPPIGNQSGPMRFSNSEGAAEKKSKRLTSRGQNHSEESAGAVRINKSRSITIWSSKKIWNIKRGWSKRFDESEEKEGKGGKSTRKISERKAVDGEA